MSSKKAKNNKVGKPTLYREEYCQKLIDHMTGGGTYEGFAAMLRVAKQTLYDWEKVHPEFLDAKKVGKSMHRHYMDGIGHGLMTGSLKGSTAVWIFLMKNIHGLKDDPVDYDEEAVDVMEFIDK